MAARQPKKRRGKEESKVHTYKTAEVDSVGMQRRSGRVAKRVYGGSDEMEQKIEERDGMRQVGAH